MNKSLKAGQVVFRAGDQADGMYLVRKGELVVFLEQSGKEVTLAKIPEGGMVGEMALFDRMPRSASVKASVDTEITHITLDDFGKLMKQIPKWFVGLMTALSGRLRSTNDRLKELESKGAGTPASVSKVSTSGGKPFQSTMRMIHVLELLWHRDGAKEGKDWMLQRKIADEELTKTFGESVEKVKDLIDLLAAEGVLVVKQDSYKNAVLSMPNRASLRQFAQFLSAFTEKNPSLQTVPEPVLNMLKSLGRMAAAAPYDQFTVTLEELLDDGKKAGFTVDTWPSQIKALDGFGDGCKPVKASSKSGIGIRVVKAEYQSLTKYLGIFNKLSERKLNT